MNKNDTTDKFEQISSGVPLPAGSIRKLSVLAPRASSEGEVTTCTTDFCPLPDGGFLELVRPPGDPTRGKLLHYEAGVFKVAESFTYGNKRYVVPALDPSLFAHLRLPTACAAAPTADELIARLAERFSLHIDATDDDLFLIATFAVQTWIYDRYHVAPYLWIVGPHGSGKTTLLRLLSAVCRRVLMVGDLTPAVLYRIVDATHPTLLIDEADRMNREIERLLRNGSTPGCMVGRASRLYDCFGAKVIASRQPSEDAALMSRAVVIGLAPSVRPVSLEIDQLQAIADEFQPQLLGFRMEHYATARPMDAPHQTGRNKDLARALSLPLYCDPPLQQKLVQYFDKLALEHELDRLTEPEGLILLALMQVSHEYQLRDKYRQTITVGSIARRAVRISAIREDEYPLSAKRAGSILRSLGIKTEPLGNMGRGLRMTKALHDRIHRLAASFGMRRSDVIGDWVGVEFVSAGIACQWCDEYGLSVQRDGTVLPTLPLPRRLTLEEKDIPETVTIGVGVDDP